MVTTLQDTGRKEHRSIGIGSGGAMDTYALQIANYLCGNDGNEAVLEINFPPPVILFETDAVIGMAGADFEARINEITLPSWRTFFVKKGSILQFEKPHSGTVAYLSVQGGWPAKKWLNSYSTHLKLGAGGIKGRALQKEDRVEFPLPAFSLDANKIFPWHISEKELDKIYQPSFTIRCLKGAEYDLLDEASKEYFEQQQFVISHQRDRMGLRLNGGPLFLKHPVQMISSAVDAGIVQLLPDNNCIVLMADHQTTGGYPRIAAVIKADIPKLAQLHSGKSFHFKLVDIKEAEDALISLNDSLGIIRSACQRNFINYLNR